MTDVGEADGGVYLVMDYVEGTTLAALQRRVIERGERIPAPIALRILADMLAGLHAAHETRGADGRPLGLVHRDVSPQNVLVGVDGVVRLTDFGIAKVVGSAGLTLTDQVKGKPAYMAPEQARARPVDRRTDVWAAGIVAYELFLGRRMFPPGDDMATLLKIVTEDPPRMRSIDPAIATALDDVVASALEREPSKRLPTAEAMRGALLDQKSIPLADPREVADYVQREIGDELDDRRRSIREATSTHLAASVEPARRVDEPSIGGLTSPSGSRSRWSARRVVVAVTASLALGGVGLYVARGHVLGAPATTLVSSSVAPLAPAVASASASVVVTSPAPSAASPASASPSAAKVAPPSATPRSTKSGTGRPSVVPTRPTTHAAPSGLTLMPDPIQ